MKPAWLIEPDLFPEYAEALAAAVRAEGHEAQFVPELPIQYRWDDVGSYYRRVYPKGACVVFHGSIGLATRIADDALWQPGAWFTREAQLFHKAATGGGEAARDDIPPAV